MGHLQCKMAILAHSAACAIPRLPPTLCSFLSTWCLTPALSRWFGRRQTRKRLIFHLKMVHDGVVGGGQLDGSCSFFARFSSPARRPFIGGNASAAGNASLGAHSPRRLRALFILCDHRVASHVPLLGGVPSVCTNALHIICIIKCPCICRPSKHANSNGSLYMTFWECRARYGSLIGFRADKTPD